MKLLRFVPFWYAPRAIIPPHDPTLPFKVYDLRAEAEDPHPHASHGHQGQAHSRRCQNVQRVQWEQLLGLDTVVIHQTATPMPPGKRDLKRAQGDEDLARAFRVQRSAYQVLLLRSGSVVRSAPMLEYRYHANILNASSVGVAVEGRYEPYPDAPGGYERLTAEQKVTLEALPELLNRWLEEEISELGPEIDLPPRQLRNLVAHRQCNPSRRGDPGWEIWSTLSRAVRLAGWHTPTAETWKHPLKGHGRRIPISWDAELGLGSY